MEPEPAASADEEHGPTLRTVTGTVAYLERIALPSPGAVVTVRIADTARQGDPPVVLGQVSFELSGQVPAPFAISIDVADVSADSQLTVWARLRSAVGTWQSADETPVPADDNGESLDLIVRRTAT